MAYIEKDPIFVSRDLQLLLEDQMLDEIRAEHSEYTPDEVDYLLMEYRKTFRNIGSVATGGEHEHTGNA